MKRYWMEFAGDADTELVPFAARGVGVTAATKEAALAVVYATIFGGHTHPKVVKLIEDIDISTLDEGHVRPNMGNPVAPGIWFPLGFQ
jgi:hypothetical protein